MKLDTIAYIGWAMHFGGRTKEELDAMTPFETIMLNDEYRCWKKENISEKTERFVEE